MNKRFSIKEVIIDYNALSLFQKLILKLYMFSFNQIKIACAVYKRAIGNDYPEKSRDFSFNNLKENPLFREFGFIKKPHSLNQTVGFKKNQPVKIVYLGNTVILSLVLPNYSSMNQLLENSNYLSQQTRIICSESSANYIHHYERQITLPNCSKYRLHQVILYKGGIDKVDDANITKLLTDEDGKSTHIFRENDYYLIQNRLLTVYEVDNYLIFREKLLKNENADQLSEFTILEKYIIDNDNNQSYLIEDNLSSSLKFHTNSWELILRSIFDSTIGTSVTSKQVYYFCLKSLACLRLNQAILFEEKFYKVMSKINSGLRTTQEDVEHVDFGFVFIPHEDLTTPPEKFAEKYNLLLNSYRYQHQLAGCIAVVFTPNSDKKRVEQSKCNIYWWVHSYNYERAVVE